MRAQNTWKPSIHAEHRFQGLGFRVQGLMNDDLHLLPSSFIVHRIIRNAGCSTPMGDQHPMPRTAEAQPRRTRGPGAPRYDDDHGDDDYDDDDYEDDENAITRA